MRCHLTILLVATLAFTGCKNLASQNGPVTLQERMLPHPNPTSYEFDASVSDVQDAIKKAFDKWREEQTKKYQVRVWKWGGDDKTQHLLTSALQSSGLLHLLWKQDGAIISKDLPNKPGNENDAYIYGGVSPVGESQVYFKSGQPLIYYGDFHIHLTAISPAKTCAEIFTYGSSVVTGVDESWSPHGPAFISVNVDPTTIEQYQILLGIGEQLGTKDMPPLVTPGPDAPVKELTLPRER